MSFTNLDFIFLFLPLFVALHAAVKGKVRNAVLFLGSIVFYALAVGKFYEWLILLMVSAVMNYLLGMIISELNGRSRKAVFVCGVLFNVVFLVTYKYAESFLTALLPALVSAGGKEITVPDIALPLGLSFYTFKNLSYLREVYAGTAESEESFIDYGAYLTMFPQISMGPIQTYKDFKPYLKSRIVSFAGISSGLAEFILGLGLKKIFADRLGSVWSGIETIGYSSISTPLAWLGIIAFSLQLYFDFYGYSLMASGIGEMLGCKTPQNFNYPYLSRSMSEFWRRWHMTLGEWFKENVYFPLGGSRCSRVRLVRNLFIVWVLTGVWHGNTLNFLLWGLFLFLLVYIEKTGALDFITENRVLSRIYMFFAVIFSWMLFKLPTISDFGVYLSRMFPFFTAAPEEVYALDWLKYAKSIGWLFVLGLLFCTPIPRRIYEKIRSKPLIAVPLLLLIFWYSIYLVACSANDPFLYFNF